MADSKLFVVAMLDFYWLWVASKYGVWRLGHEGRFHNEHLKGAVWAQWSGDDRG